MSVAVRIVEGPLGEPAPWEVPGAGAVVRFEGIVRPVEDDRELAALLYEVYEPMTTRHLRRLAEAVVEDHGLMGLRCAHSVGRVPVGACSFRLSIASAHRKEALAAMDEFIDRMKRSVPIWKVSVWAAAGQEATP